MAPQWIGDAVMAQPLVQRLAARGERVHALALPAVAPVLRAMPGIEQVLEMPFAHGRLDLRARLRIAQGLRGEGFARAYVLGNNVKARLVPWLARIPERIGWRGEAAGWLLTQALQPSPTATRQDMRLHYALLAGDCDIAALEQPRLQVAQRQARASADHHGLRQPFIALCPGAEYGPAKQWPAEQYTALAALAQTAGWRVALLGSPRERTMATAIAGALPAGAAPVSDLCGRTSMQQAIELLAAADGVVSNDSGLMHIAAALGRPTVGIYGSTDPRHTPPAAHRSRALWLHLPCSPCFARDCPLGHRNCLRALDASWAWQTLRELMQAAMPRDAA